MPQISLTDFVDIVAKSGRPKATKVRQVKERPEYEPAFDFYKLLRDHLSDVHRRGGKRAEVSDVLKALTDPKKMKNYPALVDGYKKWWGRKELSWFNPPRDVYSSAGIDLIVNPELGLVINGQRHVVKLFFKNEALTSFKTDVIVDLMEFQLRSKVQPNDKFAVLDVRESKLYAEGPHPSESMPIVNAEIAYIASIWAQ